MNLNESTIVAEIHIFLPWMRKMTQTRHILPMGVHWIQVWENETNKWEPFNQKSRRPLISDQPIRACSWFLLYFCYNLVNNIFVMIWYRNRFHCDFPDFLETIYWFNSSIDDFRIKYPRQCTFNICTFPLLLQNLQFWKDDSVVIY